MYNKENFSGEILTNRAMEAIQNNQENDLKESILNITGGHGIISSTENEILDNSFFTLRDASTLEFKKKIVVLPNGAVYNLDGLRINIFLNKIDNNTVMYAITHDNLKDENGNILPRYTLNNDINRSVSVSGFDTAYSKSESSDQLDVYFLLYIDEIKDFEFRNPDDILPNGSLGISQKWETISKLPVIMMDKCYDSDYLKKISNEKTIIDILYLPGHSNNNIKSFYKIFKNKSATEIIQLSFTNNKSPEDRSSSSIDYPFVYDVESLELGQKSRILEYRKQINIRNDNVSTIKVIGNKWREARDIYGGQDRNYVQFKYDIDNPEVRYRLSKGERFNFETIYEQTPSYTLGNHDMRIKTLGMSNIDLTTFLKSDYQSLSPYNKKNLNFEMYKLMNPKDSGANCEEVLHIGGINSRDNSTPDGYNKNNYTNNLSYEFDISQSPYNDKNLIKQNYNGSAISNVYYLIKIFNNRINFNNTDSNSSANNSTDFFNYFLPDDVFSNMFFNPLVRNNWMFNDFLKSTGRYLANFHLSPLFDYKEKTTSYTENESQLHMHFNSPLEKNINSSYTTTVNTTNFKITFYNYIVFADEECTIPLFIFGDTIFNELKYGYPSSYYSHRESDRNSAYSLFTYNNNINDNEAIIKAKSNVINNILRYYTQFDDYDKSSIERDYYYYSINNMSIDDTNNYLDYIKSKNTLTTVGNFLNGMDRSSFSNYLISIRNKTDANTRYFINTASNIVNNKNQNNPYFNNYLIYLFETNDRYKSKNFDEKETRCTLNKLYNDYDYSKDLYNEKIHKNFINYTLNTQHNTVKNIFKDYCRHNLNWNGSTKNYDEFNSKSRFHNRQQKIAIRGNSYGDSKIPSLLESLLNGKNVIKILSKHTVTSDDYGYKPIGNGYTPHMNNYYKLPIPFNMGNIDFTL